MLQHKKLPPDGDLGGDITSTDDGQFPVVFSLSRTDFKKEKIYKITHSTEILDVGR